MLVSQRIATRETLLYRLPFSAVDIEVLAGLPRGFFDGNTGGEVIELTSRKTNAHKGSITGVGEVVPFPKGD